MVSLNSQIKIPVHHASLPERDFLFKLCETSPGLTLYAHIVNYTMSYVIIQNDSEKTVSVPRNQRLGIISEIDYDNCYHVAEDNAGHLASLASRAPQVVHQTSWIKQVFAALTVTSAVAVVNLATLTPEIILANRVMIHSENY